VLLCEFRQRDWLSACNGGQIVKHFIGKRNSPGGVIRVAIEYTFHVGGLGAGCEDVPIELFRWARLIRKRLSNDLREYSCDVVIGRRLITQSVGLAIMLLGLSQAGCCRSTDILHVDPSLGERHQCNAE
jgi:hypothetical protein